MVCACCSFVNGVGLNSSTNSTELVWIALSSSATEVFSIVLGKMEELYTDTASKQLSRMFLAILFFHTSEYILAIFIHGKSKVSLSSLLISRGYLVAMVFSVLEYILEIRMCPELKEHWWISNLGLVMVVIGEVIRKLAIITAGRAFTHLIRTQHEEQHELVTRGVYGFVRHPSYSAFLIWAVGTQVMLCNPVSAIGFAVVVWRFFSKRIPYEEYYLRRFFGTNYLAYAQRTPSGVPFVK